MSHRMSAAIAACALLTAGSAARADYSYTTTSGGTTPFGAASFLILTGETQGLLNGQGFINVQDVEIATTAATGSTDSAVVPFSFTLTIAQTVGNGSTSAGTASETVTGSLNIVRSDVGNEVSFLLTGLNTAPLTIGNTTYAFSNSSYTAPTVNSPPSSATSGNLSLLVTPTFTTAVPEPASVAMVAMGLGGLFVVARRRRTA